MEQKCPIFVIRVPQITNDSIMSFASIYTASSFYQTKDVFDQGRSHSSRREGQILNILTKQPELLINNSHIKLGK